MLRLLETLLVSIFYDIRQCYVICNIRNELYNAHNILSSIQKHHSTQVYLTFTVGLGVLANQV